MGDTDQDLEAPSKLTGYRPEPLTGVSEEAVLDSEPFPILITFKGRKYTLKSTSNGGLILVGR